MFTIDKKSNKEYKIETKEAIPGEQCVCPDNDLVIEKNKNGSVKIELLGKSRLLTTS